VAAAIQILASSSSKSVRFPVFADQLGYVRSAKIDTHGIEQTVDLFIVAPVDCRQLTLGEQLEEATAGLADLLGASIYALQELVGNGDHHLGHRVSIYGIADD